MSQNILYCKQCRCQILSYELISSLQKRVYSALQRATRECRSYAFTSLPRDLEFLAECEAITCDFSQIYDYQECNVIWDDETVTGGMSLNEQIAAEIAAKGDKIAELESEISKLVPELENAERKKAKKLHDQQMAQASERTIDGTPDSKTRTPHHKHDKGGAGSVDSVESSQVSERKSRRRKKDGIE